MLNVYLFQYLYNILLLGELKHSIKGLKIVCKSLVRGLVHIQLELAHYQTPEDVKASFLHALQQLYKEDYQNILTEAIWFKGKVTITWLVLNLFKKISSNLI